MTLTDISGIIHGLPVPMLLVEPGGTVVAANPGASRLFRRPSMELVGLGNIYSQIRMSGTKAAMTFPPLFSGLPPQERERAASLFWDGIRTGEGWAFEAQHFHASDRSCHWYFDRAVPLRDSQGKVVRFVGTFTDIEPLKRAQESLWETETRLQAFFGNSRNLIF